MKKAKVLLIALFLLLLSPTGSVSAVYNRSNESVSVNPCGGGMAQYELPLTLSGSAYNGGPSRSVLVTSWLPTSLNTATNRQRARDLTKWADSSMTSATPTQPSPAGQISKGYAPSSHVNNGYQDYVLVTKNALYWFDFSSDSPVASYSASSPNGGGGMLRGVWPLKLDGTVLNFRNIRNGSNWAPNELLPGADINNITGSGISSFLTDHAEDDGITFNLEGDSNAEMVIHKPLTQLSGEPSGTLKNEGFIVQSTGKFVHTAPSADPYSVGKGSTTGHVRATTTFRIAGCDDKIFVESSWKNDAINRIGPMYSAVTATNSYGEFIIDRYGYNKFKSTDLAPELCIFRFRSDLNTHEDTCKNHQEEDFRDFLLEHEYRSSPNYDIAPPTMRVLSRLPNGNKVEPSVKFYPLSGIPSLGLIFDTHSIKNTTKMIAAFDAPYFNRGYYEPEPGLPNVDSRIAVNYAQLPSGIERIGTNYYLAHQQTITSRYLLEFR